MIRERVTAEQILKELPLPSLLKILETQIGERSRYLQTVIIARIKDFQASIWLDPKTKKDISDFKRKLNTLKLMQKQISRVEDFEESATQLSSEIIRLQRILGLKENLILLKSYRTIVKTKEPDFEKNLPNNTVELRQMLIDLEWAYIVASRGIDVDAKLKKLIDAKINLVCDRMNGI